MSDLRRSCSVALAVAWRGAHNSLTSRSFLLPTVLTPLFFFIAFAGGLSSIRTMPEFDFRSGYTSFQFVFICFQAAAFAGVSTGLTVAADFESGFSRRLLVAAPNRCAIVAGYALTAVARTLFVLAVIAVAAVVGGVRVDGGVLDVLVLLLLVIATSAVSALWAAGIALRLRTVQAGPLMQLPVFVLMFLTPVFVPLALVDGWVRDVAPLNPMTPLIEAGRGLISGQPQRTALATACLVALLVLTTAWARRGLRSAESAG